MKKNLQRASLVIVGIILGLVCAEFLLRAGGFFFLLYKGQLKTNFAETGRAYRILCLGDSFTQGIGAGYAEDYPNHLKELLNSMGIKRIFMVINRGKAGQNSSELLADLSLSLDIYRPDMVILLTGMNDGQNSHLHHLAFGKKDLSSVFKSWGSGLRIYKLAVASSVSLKGFFKKDVSKYHYEDKQIKELLSLKDYTNLEILLIKKMRKENIWEYIELANSTGSPTLAEHVIKKAVQLSPGDAWLRFTLARFYWSHSKISQAEESFIYILENFPDSKFIRFEFAEFYMAEKRFAEAKELLLNEISLHGKSQRAWWLLSNCDDEQVPKYQNNVLVPYRVTDLNVANIKKKIQDRGIVLIVLSYPQGSRISPDILKQVLFVDNHDIFSKIPYREREKLLSVDNHHCNGKGYRLIAKNILECILKNLPELNPLNAK